VTDITSTLAERGDRYGDFREQARVTQNLKRAAADSNQYANLPDYMREGIDMILHKIARMCTGDFMYLDNPHDIVGYAKLIEDRLTDDLAGGATPVSVSDPNYLSDKDLFAALIDRGITAQDYQRFLVDREDDSA
jgi:hypothetical protein